MRRCIARRWLWCGLWAAAALVSGPLLAADAAKGFLPFDAKYETVDLFPAIESGKLEVRVIPKDSTLCRLWVTNKGDLPLNVRLPEALAAVPVLAQRGQQRPNQGNPSQPLGIGAPLLQGLQGLRGPGNNQPFLNPGNAGPMGPFQPGMNRPNVFGPPMFCIPAEKTGQLRLASVCLEHGRPDPKPAIPYELKPIESVTAKPEVHELCRMLGRDEVTQRAAQAAAWHLNNGLSWQQLAAKRVGIFLAASRPLFARKELSEGKKAAEKAISLVRDRPKSADSSAVSLR